MRSFGFILNYRGVAAGYFRRGVNEEVQRRLGGEWRPPVMTINLAEADHLLAEEKWWTLTQHLNRSARDLATAGVEWFMLGSLAWYAFSSDMRFNIPLLQPFDAISGILRHHSDDAAPLGLLAPSIVSQRGSVARRLGARGSPPFVLPPPDDGQRIDDLIGAINEDQVSEGAARRFLHRMIRLLKARGATRVVVATPELSTMIAPEQRANDCYDLPALQVAAIADWMLAPRPRLLP